MDMNQMDDSTVDQEMDMLIQELEEGEPNYVTLQAPSPYSWNTDNVITHM